MKSSEERKRVGQHPFIEVIISNKLTINSFKFVSYHTDEDIGQQVIDGWLEVNQILFLRNFIINFPLPLPGKSELGVPTKKTLDVLHAFL